MADEYLKVFAGLDTSLRKYKEQFAVEAVERMKQRTPVRTGVLKESYGFTMKAKDVQFWNLAAYAAYVEYGTPLMAPRAMMRTTLLLESEQISEVAARKAGLKK